MLRSNARVVREAFDTWFASHALLARVEGCFLFAISSLYLAYHHSLELAQASCRVGRYMASCRLLRRLAADRYSRPSAPGEAASCCPHACRTHTADVLCEPQRARKEKTLSTLGEHLNTARTNTMQRRVLELWRYKVASRRWLRHCAVKGAAMFAVRMQRNVLRALRTYIRCATRLCFSLLGT